MELKGNDRFGDKKNYQKYSSREHVGSAIVIEKGTGNFRIGSNAHISGTVTSVESNIYFGDNTYVSGKVTTDSRQLHMVFVARIN
ncbi:hypothetical protein [Leptotrichia sp. oral taxon 212]|jgi:hemolysin (fragment)|uniref:hypothetical protein n=1 Tax=Leptotrichia sp. oral taxon 212 TaxID=712357 RepID=UPI0006A9451D|nr:hypothetical protein [Leptotrichia sp. oral taxon 212]ALA95073.1 hypothetical protein AMK43_02585 [Leptotrichia sp. oral taxon 212]